MSTIYRAELIRGFTVQELDISEDEAEQIENLETFYIDEEYIVGMRVADTESFTDVPGFKLGAKSNHILVVEEEYNVESSLFLAVISY